LLVNNCESVFIICLATGELNGCTTVVKNWLAAVNCLPNSSILVANSFKPSWAPCSPSVDLSASYFSLPALLFKKAAVLAGLATVLKSSFNPFLKSNNKPLISCNLIFCVALVIALFNPKYSLGVIKSLPNPIFLILVASSTIGSSNSVKALMALSDVSIIFGYWALNASYIDCALLAVAVVGITLGSPIKSAVANTFLYLTSILFKYLTKFACIVGNACQVNIVVCSIGAPASNLSNIPLYNSFSTLFLLADLHLDISGNTPIVLKKPLANLPRNVFGSAAADNERLTLFSLKLLAKASAFSPFKPSNPLNPLPAISNTGPNPAAALLNIIALRIASVAWTAACSTGGNLFISLSEISPKSNVE